MRVLVACEFSGVVRSAFRAAGHEAYSCDILPAADGGPHFQGDIIQLLACTKGAWDLMIAHPPCTHLAVSGAAHFHRKQAEQAEALAFVRALLDADIPKIALENPVSIISSRIRKPDQVIQPWQFGHDASKATCLWLKGLPKLKPTSILPAPMYGCKCGHRFEAALGAYGCPNCCGDSGPAKPIYSNQTPSGQNRMGPSADRGLKRSVTYAGIAAAMVAQWGADNADQA